MADGMTPKRPAIRWMGGKWKLAPWIIAHFPPHRVYVEPFGGGGSVLLRKPRAKAEVWNDLDGEVVNLFSVLRDEALAAGLIRQLELTPFARDELQISMDRGVADPVERARRMLIYAFQGFGANVHARVPTGLRTTRGDTSATPAMEWRSFPENLRAVVDRLRGVIIESQDAKVVMERYDGADSLHYVDPPYVWATRGEGNIYDVQYRGYAHELSDDDHRELLAFLRTLTGAVVLSGYPHRIYDEALAVGRRGGWTRVERKAFADGARARVEVLWLNPSAADGRSEATRQADWIGSGAEARDG